MFTSLLRPVAGLCLAPLFSSCLVAGLVPRNKPSSYPDWWFERDVVSRLPEYATHPDPIPLWPYQYPASDDFGVANSGQLKYVAAQAVAEFEDYLPGGAGVPLTSLITAWESDSEQADNFAAANIGQVKNVARLFYDRLIATNFVTAYPWANSPSPADDYALVNTGQLKQLFSFMAQPAIRRVDDSSFTQLPPNDDASTGSVPLGFAVGFGGAPFHACFVNNNGNITFGQPLIDYTPNTPLEALNFPIVAAYWADVDTRPIATQPVAYGPTQIDGRSAFVVNYFKVGYYEGHADKLNTFQIVLIDRSDLQSGDVDIELNYGRVLWESGDESFGSPARVGVSKGSSVSVEHPHSGEPNLLLDYNSQTGLANRDTGLIFQSLNSDVPGRFLFRIRNGHLYNDF